MTGIEIAITPFLDGGATVTALAGAAAAAVGYKQYKRDEEELVPVPELPQWRQTLQSARESVDASHQALTAAWGQPLSLYQQDEALASLAENRSWAMDIVQMANALVEEAAQLDDLDDVYEAQFQVAEREGKGVLREPVLLLRHLLDKLAEQLTNHVPRLIKAREATDAPPDVEVKRLIIGNKVTGSGDCSPGAGLAVSSEQLPIVILRGRGSLGEVWRAVYSVGDTYGEAMGRLLRRRKGEDQLEELGPLEYSPYVQEYM